MHEHEFLLVHFDEERSLAKNWGSFVLYAPPPSRPVHYKVKYKSARIELFYEQLHKKQNLKKMIQQMFVFV